MIKGDMGDQLDLADGSGTTSWSQQADTTIDNTTYQVWSNDNSAALIYVDQHVAIL